MGEEDVGDTCRPPTPRFVLQGLERGRKERETEPCVDPFPCKGWDPSARGRTGPLKESQRIKQHTLRGGNKPCFLKQHDTKGCARIKVLVFKSSQTLGLFVLQQTNMAAFWNIIRSCPCTAREGTF